MFFIGGNSDAIFGGKFDSAVVVPGGGSAGRFHSMDENQPDAAFCDVPFGSAFLRALGIGVG